MLVGEGEEEEGEERGGKKGGKSRGRRKGEVATNQDKFKTNMVIKKLFNGRRKKGTRERGEEKMKGGGSNNSDQLNLFKTMVIKNSSMYLPTYIVYLSINRHAFLCTRGRQT